MSPRTKDAIQTWSGIIAIVAVLISLLTGAVSLGRRDAKIDELGAAKVGRIEYANDQTTLAEKLGDIKSDVRSIKTMLEERAPRPRQAGEPR